MATHSSVLAWRITGTAELGRLPSMGSHSVRHDFSHIAVAACMDVRVGPLGGWSPKNRCLQTVVLKKTLESPLNSKEIKPVNPKRNQPCIYIGRMLKLKLQYFGPDNVKN